MDVKPAFECRKAGEVYSWIEPQIKNLPDEIRNRLQNTFVNDGINGESLLFLSASHFEEMNISNPLHQDIILNAIYKLYNDKTLSEYLATFPLFKSKNYDEIFFDSHIDLKTLKNKGHKISFYENIGIDDYNDIQQFLQTFEMVFTYPLIKPLPLNGIFPSQQILSIQEKINTGLPSFIPHYQIIYWNVLNLFYNKTKYMSSNDQSYLNKLKSSNNNYNKAIAAEIALYHNNIDFAKECVEYIEQNALCKRMKLMLSIEEYKDYNDAYEGCEEMFVLCEYNLQKYDGSTSDIDKIDKKLNDGIKNMEMLINTNNLSECHWRFHLIYASFLCRVTLNNEVIEQQIHLAQQKLGRNADFNYLYLAVCGDIYIKMKQFDKALYCLNSACFIMQNDGFCRSRILFIYLYRNEYDKVNKIWNKIWVDLKIGGIDDDILNSISLYINLYKNIDDEKNNEQIMSYNGEAYIGIALKLFVGTYKSGKYVGNERYKIMQTKTYKKSSDWTLRGVFDQAEYYDRIIAAFLILFVDMYVNDDIEFFSILGSTLDNIFSTFKRPLFDDMLDALCLENYLLGMFKLRWKGDCKKAFKSSIICNCRCFMNAYIGEVIGYQICGMGDIAIKKIKDIQKFISMPQLELFYADAKRMGNDAEIRQSAENDLVEMIKKDCNNYDALLSLSDLYLFEGKYQSSLLLMQQIIEKEHKLCHQNIQIKMKWGTILYFNSCLVAASEIFKEYIKKNIKASQHEYYCGIAANVFYELGENEMLKLMEQQHLLQSTNLWMNRYLCYKYWTKISYDKPYGKAYSAANKIVKYLSHHPLGYALLARTCSLMNLQEVVIPDTYGRRLRKYEKIISYWFCISMQNSFMNFSDLVNIIMDVAKFIETQPILYDPNYKNQREYKKRVVKENVMKAVKLADQLLLENNILPQLYYESMIHCGVAMYMVGYDGSEYYNKAEMNANHGQTLLTKLQRNKIKNCKKRDQIKSILISIQNKLKTTIHPKLRLFEYNLENVVNLANAWKLSQKHEPLKLSSLFVEPQVQIPTINNVECKLITRNYAKICWSASLTSNKLKQTKENVFFKVECINDNIEQKEKENFDSNFILFDKNNDKYEYKIVGLQTNRKYKMTINLFVGTQKIKDFAPIIFEFKTKTKDGLIIDDENLVEKWETMKNQRRNMYLKYKQNVLKNTNQNDSLKKYLLDHSKCDIIFCLLDNNGNQKLYPSHKLFFCAQSIIFDSMFKINNINDKSNIIPLFDTSCLTFEYVQNYVYGININTKANHELNVDNVINIWLFADKYLMHSLSSNCLEFVHQILSQTKNLQTHLKLLHKAESIPAIYNEFLATFLKNNGLTNRNECQKLFESVEFLYSSKTFVKHLINCSWLNCDEWIIFKSVIRWILMRKNLIRSERNSQIESEIITTLKPWESIKENNQYWMEFKSLIRFNRMKADTFVNNLAESNILSKKERWELLKYFALNGKNDSNITQMFNTKPRRQRIPKLITINNVDVDDIKYEQEYKFNDVKCAAGGVLVVPLLRKPKFKFKSKYFRQGNIAERYLENNANDIKLSQIFNLLDEKQIFVKLSKYINQEQSECISTTSIAALRAKIEVFENIFRCIESDNNVNWSDIYDAIIGLCHIMMNGFDASKSGKTIFVILSLKYIGLAMLNAKINYKKDNGLFTVYLNWLLSTLKQKKFYESAKNCLLNTMYQYSPKIVFTMIEKLMLESFKNENDWHPIISFLGIAIREFGINNFYPLRILRIIHLYLLKAKHQNGKDACYNLTIQIYSQIGSRWYSAVIDEMNLSKQARKSLCKAFRKIKFEHNGYHQLRCWAREKLYAKHFEK